MRYSIAALAFLAASVTPGFSAEPTRNYHAYVCAESDDVVELVRYGGNGLERVKSIKVGSFPAEIEGPHGINLSPDGRHWFVSVSHGMPFGSVHKYETGTDEWVGDVGVGMFPATLAVSPSTGLLFVVNFNLYGDMEPSTISVVETDTMIEVARIDTGIMPHGARMNADGSRLYAVNMMNDNLMEIDATTFKVARRLRLSDDEPGEHAGPAGMSMKVQPTWVTPPTPQGKVYVAGNGDSSIYEVDLAQWKVTRRFADMAKGPYNMDVTPDGETLVVTYKKASSIGIWDLKTGTERARLETTRSVPHGTVITRDGRYAFVTLEGVGGEPGAVEVYDLVEAERQAALDIGKQAGGIALWDGGS